MPRTIYKGGDAKASSVVTIKPLRQTKPLDAARRDFMATTFGAASSFSRVRCVDRATRLERSSMADSFVAANGAQSQTSDTVLLGTTPRRRR